MKTLKLVILPLLVCTLFILTAFFEESNETERINRSSEVLTSFGKLKESIPDDLLKNYEGIVVIPKLINAGLGVGGKLGKGVAVVKLANGKWSDPVFITLTGGSVGLQFGIQAVDLILVFKHKGALTKVKNGDFTLGGDASVTAGPLGRNASASTDHKFDAEIYSYSRSKGVFAGISINGSNLGIDKSANKAFYGSNISAPTIFERGISTDAAVENFKLILSSL